VLYSARIVIVASGVRTTIAASNYNSSIIYSVVRSAINSSYESYYSTCGITCSESTASIIHYEVAITDTQEWENQST
jgi:hypothetical protein